MQSNRHRGSIDRVSTMAGEAVEPSSGPIGCLLRLNQEEVAMTDYRDPNLRGDRDLDRRMNAGPWSAATWGWIAGIAVVVLILILVFGTGGDTERIATDTAKPPATTGQRTVPPASPKGPISDAPTSRPAPAPMPPAKQP
jgi:hypothetical protein